MEYSIKSLRVKPFTMDPSFIYKVGAMVCMTYMHCIQLCYETI